jgi:hypothetical protein
MKKKIEMALPRRKPRDPLAPLARKRKAGPMKDRREGSRARQRELRDALADAHR